MLLESAQKRVVANALRQQQQLQAHMEGGELWSPKNNDALRRREASPASNISSNNLLGTGADATPRRWADPAMQWSLIEPSTSTITKGGDVSVLAAFSPALGKKATSAAGVWTASPPKVVSVSLEAEEFPQTHVSPTVHRGPSSQVQSDGVVVVDLGVSTDVGATAASPQHAATSRQYDEGSGDASTAPQENPARTLLVAQCHGTLVDVLSLEDSLLSLQDDLMERARVLATSGVSAGDDSHIMEAALISHLRIVVRDELGKCKNRRTQVEAVESVCLRVK